jgi:hypothetical protein
MIVEKFIDSAFDLVTWVITLIPINISVGSLPSWLGGATSLLSIASTFVPWDIVVFCIGNIALWLTIHMAISAIRFILDFIPLF